MMRAPHRSPSSPPPDERTPVDFTPADMTRDRVHRVSPTTAHAAPRARSRALLTLALTVLAAGGGCTRKTTPADTIANGGTMIVVQPAEPTTLFPPALTDNAGLPIVDAIFDRLADIGSSLSVIGDTSFRPRLAASWSWASDSLSIAFALDSTIRWHDGAPLRAEDVRFTFETYTSDSVHADARSLLGNIDSVSVRNELTAVFWFKRRLPHQFFDATYHMYILPSHLLASVGQGQLVSAPFGRQPVGTGRFRFASWEPGVRIEIRSDTGNARGRAKLDRVIWSFTREYAAATVKLFAGEADFYEAIRAENLADAARSTILRLEPTRPLKYGYLAYNLRDSSSGAPHRIFGDVRVRRALAMAVDREKMARNVFESFGAVALAPTPRILIPDSAALRQPPYNPTAAKALLDSAGWVVSGNDSVRSRNGVRLSFEMMAAQSSQAGQRYAVLLQDQLRSIGVDVRVRVLPGQSMGDRVEAHHFDTFMNAFGVTPGRLGMGQVWGRGGSMNFGAYNDAVFDATLDSAFTTFNEAASRAIWTRVLQRLIDEQPGLWLYEESTPVAIHRRIRNRPLRADAWYAELADWTTDPAQRLPRDRVGLGSAR